MQNAVISCSVGKRSGGKTEPRAMDSRNAARIAREITPGGTCNTVRSIENAWKVDFRSSQNDAEAVRAWPMGAHRYFAGPTSSVFNLIEPHALKWTEFIATAIDGSWCKFARVQ